MRWTWRQFRGLLFACTLIYGATYIPPVKDIARVGLSPIVREIRQAGDTVAANVSLILNIDTVAKENGQLRARVNEFSAIEIENTELRHENELLRKELQLSQPQTGSKLIVAQVISRTSSVSQQSLIINKGSEDGFVDGMAVVAQGYLIGQAEEVLSNTTRVRLLTSIDSLLPVVLQNSRSIGLLKGGTGGLIIDEISRDVTIESDEAVVTSHIGDIVKSGIPVGRVTAIVSGKSDVFQSARMVSPIDLSRLEVVFGVK